MFNLSKSADSGHDPIGEIAEEIISRANLSSLLPEDAKFLKENLILQINRRLGLIIAENLNEEGRDEYVRLLESGPVPAPDKLQNIINKYIPDYQEKIKLGLEEFTRQAVASLVK